MAASLLLVIVFLPFVTGKRSVRPESAAKITTPAPSAADPVKPVQPEASPATCYAALRAAGVSYRVLSDATADSIAAPILLTGPILGLRVHGTGKLDAVTNYLDCRLAQTLLTWAPLLQARGIVGIEHYSMYRSEAVVGSSTKQSGHATGRAIDVAKLELSDGRTLSVLDDWKNRASGGDPCKPWPDAPAGKMLRGLVCDAASRGLFQIVVTPHYNEAHGNHVHLEVEPHATELWIR